MPDEAAQWIAQALEDLDTARALRAISRIPPRVPAFHYQQAAEKALKAALLAAGKVPPRVHDLRALVVALGRPGGLNPKEASELSPYAVLARYPGFGDVPSAQQLDAFDVFAAACIEWARRSIDTNV